MTHKCYGCGRTFAHKTGLSNHRRVCIKWKDYDDVTVQKKRRLEQDHDTIPADPLTDPPQNFLDPGTLITEVFHLHP